MVNQEAAGVAALPDPWGWVCRLALGTGLHRGELTRLQRSDLHGDCLVIHHTKSGKLRRVPLNFDRALLPEVRGRLGKLVPFSSRSSGAFNSVVKKHGGLPRFHVHQTRHTFACQWMERGGSLAALQQILGHSTVVMTQRYGRLSDEAVRAEAERLSRG